MTRKAKLGTWKGPLPEGHPLKGTHVFFTSSMSAEQKKRLKERFGKKREAAPDGASDSSSKDQGKSE